MSNHHDDELPTIDLAALEAVTGGAGDDMMSMLLPMMLAKNKQASAAPPPAPAPAAPVLPKIMVDGVEQQPQSSGNGTGSLSYTLNA